MPPPADAAPVPRPVPTPRTPPAAPPAPLASPPASSLAGSPRSRPPAPRAVSFAARDGLRLAALDWEGPPAGTRTPILCLPGLCRTAHDYEPLAARHAGRRRVVALDYAGHGDSARADSLARYSPEQALRDVLDATAALGLARVALVGTSFGGILAMVLAAFRPRLLAAVALNDIGPRIEPQGRDSVRDFVGHDPAAISLEAAAEFLRERLPPLGIADAAGWRRMAGLTYALGPDGRWHPRWDTRIAEVTGDGAAALEPVLWGCFGALAHLPLLLVHGEASRLLSADTVARMRRMRPDMTLVQLPGIGHAPLLSEPESIRALDAFLDDVA
ncbi:alpha/beta hydrolase [Roseomonas sp. NAR14]|uniref:Alpha/beta hydrolase n=1 Tax=Roseomonas acroporae TaxID=2937791 RepID=A0A9X1Y3N5_9PROT|nr:alpha/beta hydrolase [Roseomonas acroporae]MCK8783559.1 alpha/beta hydrolase [Roseomonas acroporae]